MRLNWLCRSNPKSDIDGDDVASVKILSCLSFNSFINQKNSQEGIKNIDSEDIKNANKLGYKIKLLGYSEIYKNKYIKEFIQYYQKHHVVVASDGDNAVIIDGKPIGQNIIQGEGVILLQQHQL